MATHKSSNFAWHYSPLHEEDYLNSMLSQSAKREFDEVSVGVEPSCSLRWTDLYVVFMNSRTLVMEANGLLPTPDGELQVMAEVMRDNHKHLRKVLFLVAIERLFRLGSQNAREVLWTYAEELVLVDMISGHLAETEEEVAQVQAHFEAVFCQ